MLSQEIQASSGATPGINIDGERLQKGLAKLVLVIVEMLRQVLERQAARRVESGTLTSEEVERLGVAFMQIKERMGLISEQFGLERDEADGTLRGMLRAGNGRLAGATLVDVIDSLLSKGAVIGGRVTVSVADIDLIALDLLATISAVPGSSGGGRHGR